MKTKQERLATIEAEAKALREEIEAEAKKPRPVHYGEEIRARHSDHSFVLGENTNKHGTTELFGMYSGLSKGNSGWIS